MVGVDGSEESARALAWAAEEARLRGCQLEVVYAFDRHPEWIRYGFVPTVEGVVLEGIERSAAEAGNETAADLAREHADELIRSMLAESVGDEVEVLRSVADQHKPAPYLVERSRSAEFLVVGSRGRGSVGSMLLGSVSTYCVHHAECPVVVIK